MKNKEKLWAVFSRGLEIQMTMEQALSASHQGQCVQEVQELLKDPDILAQLDKIPVDSIREELKEYGAWDEEELKDDVKNRERIIWLAACDIVEREP